MSLRVTIGVSGQKEVSRSLAIVAKDIKDLRPAWNKLEKILNKFQARVFSGKGRASSARWFGIDASQELDEWEPLEESTIKQKRAQGFGRYATFPLIRTGKLRDGFTKNGAAGAVRVKRRKTFIWGIDEKAIPYAKFHQLGTSKLPRRAVLRVPNNLRRIVVKVIQQHLAKSGQLVRSRLGRRLAE